MKYVMFIVNLFFECFQYAIRDIMLFPGTNLLKVFYIALGISTISLFSWVFDLPQFLDWRGGFLGTAILGIIILISLKEDLK